MKPEQITALAREYAEFTDMSPVDKKNISAICECFLKFVLRRYCFVEKAKAREEYEDNYRQYLAAGNARPLRQQYFFGRCFAVMSLFPEIAKEVEE